MTIENIIKAVIFDMDGLLIDSEPIWREVEVKIFTEVGVPLTKEKAKETMGLRVDEVVEHWFSLYPWEEPTKKEIESKIVKGVIELIKQKGVAQGGVEKIVKFFANKNIPMAIASSSQTEIINAVLEKILIDKYIKVIHSAEHEPYGKPHPGVYITTAKKLNTNPEYCLAFEDSLNGVLAAKTAKMKCVAIPDQDSKDEKGFCIADVVIDSLEDFCFEHLGKINQLFLPKEDMKKSKNPILTKEIFDKEITFCKKLFKENKGKCNWGKCKNCGVIPLLYKLHKGKLLEDSAEIDKIKNKLFKNNKL